MFNDRYGLTKAVLEGRKTMTRRIIKPQPIEFLCVEKSPDRYMEIIQEDDLALRIKSHYKVGEVVAVAQRYSTSKSTGDGRLSIVHPNCAVNGTTAFCSKGWDNKMFVRAELMPHQIRITGIRCERLQDITEWDAEREGICAVWDEGFVKGWTNKSDGKIYDDKIEAFAALIDKVSCRGTWQSNPYVWVYEFELIK